MTNPQNVSDTDDVAVLDQTIRDHESELAAENAALVELNHRLEAGEDVPRKTITEQRWTIDALMTKLRGARARRTRAAHRDRLDRLHARREVYSTRLDDHAAALDRGWSEAVAAAVSLLQAGESYNLDVAGMNRELSEDAVPSYSGPFPTPAPAHAELATHRGGQSLTIGDRRYDVVPAAEAILQRFIGDVLAVHHGHADQQRGRPETVSVKTSANDTTTWWIHEEHGGLVQLDPAGISSASTANMRRLTLDEVRAHVHGPDGDTVTADQHAAAVERAAATPKPSRRKAA